MTTKTPSTPSAAPTPVAAAAKKAVQQATSGTPAPEQAAVAPAPAPAPTKKAAVADKGKKAAKQAAAKPAKQTKAAQKTATKKAAEAPEKQEPAKEPKLKKPKLVRDSFTIPKDEYAAIDALKLRGAKLDHQVKKSELLRAGLKLLTSLDDKALMAALQAVPAIKTGRPAKN